MAKSFFSDTELATGQETMSDVLIAWGNEVVKALKKSLDDKTSDGTSGELEQSIVVLPINYLGQKWQLQFKAADYWKFINKGVQGAGKNTAIDGSKARKSYSNKAPSSPFKYTNKKPGVNFSSITGGSLRQWAYNKGLNPYAVRESIFRRGIKPTFFFDSVVNKSLKEDLIERLEKVGAKEVEITLSKEFK